MWTQFSEGARRVVFFAQQEAERFNVRSVTPEHLLLGITRDGNNVAAVILQRMGIPPDTLRNQILVNEALLKQAQGNSASPAQDMQLAEESKQALDLAYEEAKELGNTYIGTEHMLAGIVRYGRGHAVQVLAALGIDAPKVHQHILDYEEPDQEYTEGQKPQELPEAP